MTSLTQQNVFGWLCGAGGRTWQGVLLNADAMLVRAPRATLMGSTALRALVDVDGRVVDAQIKEIRLLDVDGQPDNPCTAMLQLVRIPGAPLPARINRDGFSLALRVTGDVWEAVRSLGLIPDRQADPPPRPATRTDPRPVPVRIVEVNAEDWCAIFWWLC